MKKILSQPRIIHYELIRIYISPTEQASSALIQIVSMLLEKKRELNSNVFH